MQTYLERRSVLPDGGHAELVWRMDALPRMGPHRAGRSGSDGLVRGQDQAVAALVTMEASKRQRGYWVEPQQLAMFDLTG